MKPGRNGERSQPLLLLGEQLEQPSLASALERWGIDGPVALVSAGWEEDETDDQWVGKATGRTVVNALLYGLADRLFAADPEVLQLLRTRQDEMRRLREVNKIQLDHLLAIARELLKREFAGEAVGGPANLTLEQVRAVDREYLVLVDEVITRYDRMIDPKARPSVCHYRDEVLQRVHQCQALLIAGGHAGVLLNRLSLSRLLKHLAVPVIAWSGGAMAMGDRLVFYHQFIPHATGDAELSRHGMKWFHSLLPFPRADERIKLDSQVEVALLARRFQPDVCLALDHDSSLEWDARSLVRAVGVRELQAGGHVTEWTP